MNEEFRNPLTKEALETVVGFRVLSWPGEYVTACTHKSALRFMPGQRHSFEKLEFLGDAVLGFVVGKHLYDAYPDENEGFLTQMRTKLVSGKALSDIARKMGLDRLVIMSPKALRSGFNTNPRILEDVLESLIGAVFLDAGMVAARTFVMTILDRYIDRQSLTKNTNYKDILMQYCQARGRDLPNYDHVPEQQQQQQHQQHGTFCVLTHACGVRGYGRGATKKLAEQQSAKHVLMMLGVRVDE